MDQQTPITPDVTTPPSAPTPTPQNTTPLLEEPNKLNQLVQKLPKNPLAIAATGIVLTGLVAALILVGQAQDTRKRAYHVTAPTVPTAPITPTGIATTPTPFVTPASTPTPKPPTPTPAPSATPKPTISPTNTPIPTPVANCVRKQPTLSIRPFSQVTRAGTTLTYAVNFKNNDLNCPPTAFQYSISGPKNFQLQTAPMPILASQQSFNAGLRVTSPSNARIGAYIINANAFSSSHRRVSTYSLYVVNPLFRIPNPRLIPIPSLPTEPAF